MKKSNIKTNTSIDDSRRIYGFVESISKPVEGSPYSRINIVLDSVDGHAFDREQAQERSPKYLSLVRIMTTPKRLLDLFDVSTSVNEADWFQATLANRPGMPRAWILEASNDYSGKILATNLIGFKRIDKTRATNLSFDDSKINALQEWCKITANTLSKPKEHNLQTLASFNVRIIDVGHASFSAIHTNSTVASKILGYFDVGGPIYFHHHTFPKKFNEASRVPKEGFVALSHWDFDHYSLAVTKLQSLQNLTWYAPNQLVGPNAARFQKLLGNHLNFVNTATFQIGGGIQMWKGSGLPSDRNNSGYVITVPHKNGSTLLTGDVSYSSVPIAAKANLTALGVTHHGGSGSNSPPVPLNGNGIAAVSFGIPNRYHHPNWTDLAAHGSVGWNVSPTYINSSSRGDVWLP